MGRDIVRYAKAAQLRRQLRTKEAEWTVRLTRIAVQDVPSLKGIEVPVSSCLTVISGANGSGKTTLLRALWAALDPKLAAASLYADPRLIAGKAEASLTVGEEQHDLSVTFPLNGDTEGGTGDVEVIYIDSAAETRKMQDIFLSFESVDELTNGVAAREIKADELSEISYILSRDYRTMRVFEVEIGQGDVAPFFEASYGDDSYDSRTMGAGEICALQIWWKLTQTSANCIVLFEEPEAFLSYTCQANLRDFIVASIVEKKLVCVIGSHAAPFVAGVGKESVAFLSRGAEGMQVVGSPVPPIVLKSVGIEPPIIAVVLVEDSIGRLAFKAVIEKMDPAIGRQIQIEVRSGDGEVVKLLKETRSFTGPFKIIGAFDGDMDGKVPKAIEQLSMLLPGKEALEIELRKVARERFDDFEAVAGVANLRVIVDGLQGSDHHDWFSQLSTESGIGYDQLFTLLFGLWIEDEDNAAQVGRSYGRLLQILGRA